MSLAVYNTAILRLQEEFLQSKGLDEWEIHHYAWEERMLVDLRANTHILYVTIDSGHPVNRLIRINTLDTVMYLLVKYGCLAFYVAPAEMRQWQVEWQLEHDLTTVEWLGDIDNAEGTAGAGTALMMLIEALKEYYR